MIGPVVLLAALCYIAFKLGQGWERANHAPGPHELADDLKRAAARGQWETE